MLGARTLRNRVPGNDQKVTLFDPFRPGFEVKTHSNWRVIAKPDLMKPVILDMNRTSLDSDPDPSMSLFIFGTDNVTPRTMSLRGE